MVAGNQNTDKGLLPAGNSVNTKKLSASQLASVQAANNVNAQRLIAADVTKVVGANVQLDSSGQPSEVRAHAALFRALYQALKSWHFLEHLTEHLIVDTGDPALCRASLGAFSKC